MIKFEISDRQVMDALGRLLDAGQDMSGPMDDIRRLLENATEDAFQNQADPWGNPWQDLAESTKAARAKKGHWPGSILQVSGGLIGSLSGDSGPDWAEAGFGKVFAAIQNLGGKAGRGGKTTIPARRSLPINEAGELPPDLSSDILDVLQDYLGDALKG
jgi:phage virion morphogenesis protein